MSPLLFLFLNTSSFAFEEGLKESSHAPLVLPSELELGVLPPINLTFSSTLLKDSLERGREPSPAVSPSDLESAFYLAFCERSSQKPLTPQAAHETYALLKDIIARNTPGLSGRARFLFAKLTMQGYFIPFYEDPAEKEARHMTAYHYFSLVQEDENAAYLLKDYSKFYKAYLGYTKQVSALKDQDAYFYLREITSNLRLPLSLRLRALFYAALLLEAKRAFSVNHTALDFFSFIFHHLEAPSHFKSYALQYMRQQSSKDLARINLAHIWN